jgi:hypothetical protein
VIVTGRLDLVPLVPAILELIARDDTTEAARRLDAEVPQDAGPGELALGGVEHRHEVSEVRADGLDLGGQDNLVLVGHGLRVVALQKAAQALDDT